MKINVLSDEALLSRTERLARIERKISVQLINPLQEVDRRRLHLKRGFHSLYDYVVRGLKFSGGSAHRRVQATKVCEALPELKDLIESGDSNITQAMQLQGYFDRHDTPIREKRELLEKVEGMSTRETERVIAALEPEAPPRDRERAISEEHTVITFAADHELMEMLERLKNLTGKTNYLELFKLAAKKALHQIDPKEKAKRARPSKQTQPSSPATSTSTSSITSTSSSTSTTTTTSTAPAPGRKPRAQTTYQLHDRDHDECQFVDEKTGRKCGSRFTPQKEHRIPWAKGGPTTLENMELLCPAHNALRAIEAYGEEKMRPDLRTPAAGS